MLRNETLERDGGPVLQHEAPTTTAAPTKELADDTVALFADKSVQAQPGGAR